MKPINVPNAVGQIVLAFFVCLSMITVHSQSSGKNRLITSASQRSAAAKASAPTDPELIQPEDLARVLQSANGQKPLIIQVGFRVLYSQAHIPGSEYIGPASKADGIRPLRKRVEGLPHTQPIVLYCGCCPWSKCPNINPAYSELRGLGFKDVKVLYIANNFGVDWVAKGWPVAKGE